MIIFLKIAALGESMHSSDRILLTFYEFELVTIFLIIFELVFSASSIFKKNISFRFLVEIQDSVYF